MKCFSEICRGLIEKCAIKNNKIVPRDIANDILEKIAMDDLFDSACILISRNLALEAFQNIKGITSYGVYLDDEAKIAIEKEFLDRDMEPSELEKIAIA